MEIVHLAKDRHDDWNEFCLKSNDAWFWHTTDWLEYSLNYRPEYRSRSLSFMVTENKEILAICPLIIETRGGIKEFTFGGYMTWTPSPAFADVSSKKREKVANQVFAHIDSLAMENNVSRAFMVIPPLTFPRNNYLMKYGYMNISLNTQVIDLQNGLMDIHSNLRKGHDYDIDRGLKKLNTIVVSNNILNINDTRDIFDHYKNLLHKDTSHSYESRPNTTFDMQFDWIKQGYGILIGAYSNLKEYIGFSYVTIYKDGAYYGSACNIDPKLPIAHVLTWKTIEWLKEHGYRYYELGWQQYSNQLYNFPSKKEKEISFFKRGFGGIAVPLFRGEKYYNKDYFLKISQGRIQKYVDELDG